MIIVTGATGHLGHATVEQLLERIAPDQVGVSVRDPQKAQDLRDRGVRVRQGDFDDPSSLAHAFEDATQVLIVSGPSGARVHRTAIEAAKAAGARRILYTSHMGARSDSPFEPGIGHAETERDLQASGVEFTSLRNGFYASSALFLMGDVLTTGQLVAPEDGPVSWTAREDLAVPAALALLGDEHLDGISPPLTGSQALDFADIATIASDLTGREITRVTVSDAEWVAGLAARGMPENYADLLLGMFVAARRGDFAAVDPTLEKMLGHPPTTFRDVLAATL